MSSVRSRGETSHVSASAGGVDLLSKQVFCCYCDKAPDADDEDDDLWERVVFFFPYGFNATKNRNNLLFLIGTCDAFGEFNRMVQQSTATPIKSHQAQPGDVAVLRLEQMAIGRLHLGELNFVLGSPSGLPDDLLRQQLIDAVRAFVFYNGPLEEFEEHWGRGPFLKALGQCAKDVWPLLSESNHIENPLRAIASVHYYQDSQSANTLIAAEQLLSHISEGNAFASAIFFDRSVICTQIEDSSIMRWILNRMNPQSRRTIQRSRRSHSPNDRDPSTSMMPAFTQFHKDNCDGESGREAASTDPRLSFSISASTHERTDLYPVWLQRATFNSLMATEKRLKECLGGGMGSLPPSHLGNEAWVEQPIGRPPPPPGGPPAESSNVMGQGSFRSQERATLPAYLTEDQEEGKFVGLCLHTVSRMTVAVLIPLESLYDDLHVGRVRLLGGKLLALERLIKSSTTSGSTNCPPLRKGSGGGGKIQGDFSPRGLAPPDEDDLLSVASETRSSSSSENSRSTSIVQTVTHTRGEETDCADPSLITTICGPCQQPLALPSAPSFQVSLTHSFLCVDTLDCSLTSSGTLSNGFISLVLVAQSRFGGMGNLEEKCWYPRSRVPLNKEMKEVVEGVIQRPEPNRSNRWQKAQQRRRGRMAGNKYIAVTNLGLFVARQVRSQQTFFLFRKPQGGGAGFLRVERAEDLAREITERELGQFYL